MQQPEFIRSAANVYGLCRARPFLDKLSSLAYVAGQRSALEVPLRNAIIADLAEEQRLLRRQDHSGDVDRRHIAAGLQHLRSLGDYPWEKLDKTAKGALRPIYGAVNSMLSARWFEYLLPWRRQVDVDSVTRDLLQPLRVAAFGTDKVETVPFIPDPMRSVESDLALRATSSN